MNRGRNAPFLRIHVVQCILHNLMDTMPKQLVITTDLGDEPRLPISEILAMQEIHARILTLIKHYPRHFANQIKQHEETYKWVLDNTKVVHSEHIPEIVYSALTGEDGKCHHGAQRSVKRISDGWLCCGYAKTCKCVQETMPGRVSKSRNNRTDEAKAREQIRRETTMIKTTGYAFNGQRPSVKAILKRPKVSASVYEKLSNYEWLNREYNAYRRTLQSIAKELGVDLGTVKDYCVKQGFHIRQNTNRSEQERMLCENFDSTGIIYESSNFTVLGTHEIDIYLPEYRLGIEVNGLYWHSHHPDDATPFPHLKHQSKTLRASEVGIKVIHITDLEIKTHFADVCKLIHDVMDGEDILLGTPKKYWTDGEHIYEPQVHIPDEYMYSLKFRSYTCDGAGILLLGQCMQ